MQSQNKLRIAVLGASGYAACELMERIHAHPHAVLTIATTREQPAPLVADLHPRLRGRVDLACTPFDPEQIAQNADLVFAALPHGASIPAVHALVNRGLRVIDLSADYRLPDAAMYERVYGLKHEDPANLAEAVYSVSEWHGASLSTARVVANPGCYPTTVFLALAPLLTEGLVGLDDILVDSKSGVSGAGRTPKLTTHFPECNESVVAYSVGNHRHVPEMEAHLSRLARASVKLTFTPHLMPMDRGMLSTIYAPMIADIPEADIVNIFLKYYLDKPFVRLVDKPPSTKDSVGTNFCDLHVRRLGKRVVVFAALDNLVKGAAGQAIQNMNLMLGWPETAGLL